MRAGEGALIDKELPAGRLIVPNAWSHEHGPNEDRTAHAQQLMWDLFTNTLEAAKILGEDPARQHRLTDACARLAGAGRSRPRLA